MNDEDAVLATNETFYRAFAKGDGKAMEMIWAEKHPVVCIHPGWDALTDRLSVMESWHGILQSAPPVRCRGAQAFLYGETALVICEEHIHGGLLVATNLFVREDGIWKIAHHQAGQVFELSVDEEDDEDVVDEDDEDEDEDDEPDSSNVVH